jgi:hypothetical protein
MCHELVYPLVSPTFDSYESKILFLPMLGTQGAYKDQHLKE